MNDEDVIRQIGQESADALKRGDAKGFAASFTADADYLDSFGRLSQGRDQIEETIAALVAGPYQSVTVTNRAEAIRFIAPAVALLDFTSDLQMSSAVRKLRGVSVLVKQDGQWLVAAARSFLLPSA